MSVLNNQGNITMIPKNIKARPTEEVDTFIESAPDAGKPNKKEPSGKAQQITLTLNPELLEKVDKTAAALSLSRAGFIKMCLSNAVKS